MFPSVELRYQADTLAVGLAPTHLTTALSFGLLIVALIGDTVAETSSTPQGVKHNGRIGALSSESSSVVGN